MPVLFPSIGTVVMKPVEFTVEDLARLKRTFHSIKSFQNGQLSETIELMHELIAASTKPGVTAEHLDMTSSGFTSLSYSLTEHGVEKLNNNHLLDLVFILLFGSMFWINAAFAYHLRDVRDGKESIGKVKALQNFDDLKSILDPLFENPIIEKTRK